MHPVLMPGKLADRRLLIEISLYPRNGSLRRWLGLTNDNQKLATASHFFRFGVA